MPVTDMTSSFQSGLALCAIIHRYRPDLIHYAGLEQEDIAGNNQLAFDILEGELGIPPVTTGREVAAGVEAGRAPDKLAMISYLTQIYELFRKEIPHTLQQDQECDDLDDSVFCHNHQAGRERRGKHRHRDREKGGGGQGIGALVAGEAAERTGRRKRRSVEGGVGEGDEELRSPTQRVSNKKRLAKLMERAALQEAKRKEGAEPKNIKNEERYKIIEEQFMGGTR